ncbi:DUF4186 domain-containing protein [Ameyamaea chiangmaiensis]|uniref:DUF4186 domain-containing protein n=2 Tax=Ameyamaea chiangmaiensis TaxID=442969 RepID=A0A850PEH3_9PROT|nr:DUF4186 domain-containing protein [Ameyamaea chiangmaiensis]
MHPIDPGLWARLARSSFRSRFRLDLQDQLYLASRTPHVIAEHAASFVATRIAPERPRQDGRQTPWRGHPVFVAQHATATCCRSCIAKWHALPKGRALTAPEQRYVVSVISAWLEQRRDDPRQHAEPDGRQFDLLDSPAPHEQS